MEEEDSDSDDEDDDEELFFLWDDNRVEKLGEDEPVQLLLNLTSLALRLRTLLEL